MKLLVSVRCAAEVEAALAGGADIIDAKEPGRGSLGPVSPEVFAQIAAQVPRQVSVSAALGDHGVFDQVASAVTSLPLSPRPAPLYLKLGFAGLRSQSRIEQLIATAVNTASSHGTALIVAVAYADAARAGTATPDAISRVASQAGAAGVLLDTHTKDGIGLLGWVTPEALKRWVGEAREAGLVTALAGGLCLDDVDEVYQAKPDVLGVRGAACDGGREGPVNPMRVRALRQRLDQASGSVQGSPASRLPAGSRNA